MMYPNFNRKEATDRELEMQSSLLHLSAEELAESALGSWFQPGQYVGSKRLRLTSAGLAANLLATKVSPAEVEILMQRAREIRDRVRKASFSD